MEAVRGKEEERGKIPSFETIKLTEFFTKCKTLADAKKFVYVADMTGKVATACEYGDNTSMMDFHAEVKKCII